MKITVDDILCYVIQLKLKRTISLISMSYWRLIVRYLMHW